MRHPSQARRSPIPMKRRGSVVLRSPRFVLMHDDHPLAGESSVDYEQIAHERAEVFIQAPSGPSHKCVVVGELGVLLAAEIADRYSPADREALLKGLPKHAVLECASPSVPAGRPRRQPARIRAG